MKVGLAAGALRRLTLAHPDLGPRAWKVNLGRAPDQDDDGVYALIWNPEP